MTAITFWLLAHMLIGMRGRRGKERKKINEGENVEKCGETEYEEETDKREFSRGPCPVTRIVIKSRFYQTDESDHL